LNQPEGDVTMKIEETQLRAFATRYTAAWCSQDCTRVAAHFSVNGWLRINGGKRASGRSAIEESAQGFMTTFPDLRLVMDNVFLKGDGAEFHWTLTGTIAGPGGTGRSVRISGFEEWKLGENGLIDESEGHFDEADYLRQLEGTA
jgi:hypothetical protein